MLGFGALALAGLAVDPDLGRSFAEWCGVVDVVIAAELVSRL